MDLTDTQFHSFRKVSTQLSQPNTLEQTKEIFPVLPQSGALKGAVKTESNEKHIEALDDAPGLLRTLAKELTGGVPKQPSLVLLDTEVAPGTSTRLEWSPSVSFMGLSVHVF